MRGVYVGGMARAIGALGLRNSLDEILAVSAGAFTGAGLIGGCTDNLARAYYDDLAAGGFVDYGRMLSGRGPLVSLDFLLDTVMVKRYGFDWAALIGSDLPAAPGRDRARHGFRQRAGRSAGRGRLAPGAARVGNDPVLGRPAGRAARASVGRRLRHRPIAGSASRRRRRDPRTRLAGQGAQRAPVAVESGDAADAGAPEPAGPRAGPGDDSARSTTPGVDGADQRTPSPRQRTHHGPTPAPQSRHPLAHQ